MHLRTLQLLTVTAVHCCSGSAGNNKAHTYPVVGHTTAVKLLTLAVKKRKRKQEVSVVVVCAVGAVWYSTLYWQAGWQAAPFLFLCSRSRFGPHILLAACAWRVEIK
jgi:hypothetical protein